MEIFSKASPETPVEESSIIFRSCLTDKPLDKRINDRLEAKEYATALCNFIRNADTPVTIGIQGGWGSGKTSLITIMQEELSAPPSDDTTEPTLCVMVNAWEHSLFQGTDNKAEVALSLLNGLAKGAKKVIEKTDWIAPEIKIEITEQTSKVETALNGIKMGLGFLLKAGAQIGSNMIGGGDISNVKLQERKTIPQMEIPPIAENVTTLRKSLANLIKKIKYKNHPVKVVFFIDDLDRVSPPTAVEILDITKNIFDIPNCVFVLAIDYDVVVKGLEEKFGKKDENNEREFRQYFDKIIQIPFTMPIGAYALSINKLLEPALQRLGNKISPEDSKTLEQLADDACLATGGIPRSIKRIINTLSLLQHIDDAKKNKKGQKNQEGLPQDLEARFIIVALHINFPEIARKLMSMPDFTKWKPEELDIPWKLNLKENKPSLETLGNDQYFNDPWEKVVYCLCTSSSWLKSQARNVSHLLNNLLIALENNATATSLSEDSVNVLKNIMESIKVVSIDDEANQQAIEFDNSSVKTDALSVFCKKMQNELAQVLPEGVMAPYISGYAKGNRQSGGRIFSVSLNNTAITEFDIEYYQNENCLDMVFYGDKSRVSVKKGEPFMEKVLEKLGQDFIGEVRGGDFYLGIEKELSIKDFEILEPKTFIPQLVEAYKLSEKIAEQFKNLKLKN